MSKKIITQTWQIVCGSMEIEKLSKHGFIKEWQPRTERHALFMAIKYPEQRFYKGGWGPELLHFVDDGPYRGKVGKIFCSYDRYRHIANWFLITTFPP